MVDYNGKQYIFDIKKIVEFVNYSDKNQIKEQEITDVMEIGDDGGFEITSKAIRETTSAGNPQIDNIKYDLVKNFILQVISFEEYDGNNLPFGLTIVMDTLIYEGFLKEVKYGE